MYSFHEFIFYKPTRQLYIRTNIKKLKNINVKVILYRNYGLGQIAFPLLIGLNFFLGLKHVIMRLNFKITLELNINNL